MYACVCVCMCVCVRACTYVHTHVYSLDMVRKQQPGYWSHIRKYHMDFSASGLQEVWQKNFSKLTSIFNSIHYIKAIDQYSHTEKHMLNVVENSLSSTKDHLLCNKWGSYCRSVCMHPLLSNYIWCMIYSHRLLAHGVILFLLHKLSLCFIIRESWKSWIMTKVTSAD